MTDEARSAVASFLSVHKGQEKGIARLTTSAAAKDHPFIDTAYQYLEEIWTEVQRESAVHTGTAVSFGQSSLPQHGLLRSKQICTRVVISVA